MDLVAFVRHQLSHAKKVRDGNVETLRTVLRLDSPKDIKIVRDFLRGGEEARIVGEAGGYLWVLTIYTYAYLLIPKR